jgi:hypothetical protein
MGLLVGFGGLGEDALGKVEFAAQGGEHAHDRRCFALDRLIEFRSQRVHVAPLAETFFERSELFAELGR